MSDSDKPQIIDEQLYPRSVAGQFLGGASIATLRRMEQLGILRPIRRNKHSPTAQVFYTGKNLRAAASE